MIVVCRFLVYMVEFVKEIGRDTDVNVRVVSMVTIVLKVNKTFGIISFSFIHPSKDWTYYRIPSFAHTEVCL